MNKLLIQGIVLILMLVALPLTSFGSTADALWLSIAGLAVFGIASLTPPVLRFVGDSADRDDDTPDGKKDDGSSKRKKEEP